MALYKELYQEFDGDSISYTYHRVVSVVMITNLHNIIEVHSYRNQDRREVEKEEISSGSMITVSTEVKRITMPYVEENPIKAAYEYLKTLPEFEGSVDV